jgi:hypothetical protein
MRQICFLQKLKNTGLCPVNPGVKGGLAPPAHPGYFDLVSSGQAKLHRAKWPGNTV